MTVFHLDGSFSFGMVLKVNHSFARRTSVTVAMDLDTFRTQLLQERYRERKRETE